MLELPPRRALLYVPGGLQCLIIPGSRPRIPHANASGAALQHLLEHVRVRRPPTQAAAPAHLSPTQTESIAGDSEKKIGKAAELGVDVVCLDLEDAVAQGRKDAARETAAKVRHAVAGC